MLIVIRKMKKVENQVKKTNPFSVEIEVKEGVTLSLDKKVLTVNGPKGTNKRVVGTLLGELMVHSSAV